MGELVRRSSLAIFSAAVLTGAGLLTLPATMTAASASTRPDISKCVLTAYYPTSNGKVRAAASFSCAGEDTIQVQTCLQQLVTGGWENVVGSCATSPTEFTTFVSATGKSYDATCGRWYRTWAWGYNDGDTGTALSDSYQGCT
jgi:hypothetical protein